jgi:hypothetical protein
MSPRSSGRYCGSSSKGSKTDSRPQVPAHPWRPASGGDLRALLRLCGQCQPALFIVRSSMVSSVPTGKGCNFTLGCCVLRTSLPCNARCVPVCCGSSHAAGSSRPRLRPRCASGTTGVASPSTPGSASKPHPLTHPGYPKRAFPSPRGPPNHRPPLRRDSTRCKRALNLVSSSSHRDRGSAATMFLATQSIALACPLYPPVYVGGGCARVSLVYRCV